MSDTIKFAGSGEVSSWRLTHIGAPNRTVLDMKAPNNSTVSNTVTDGDIDPNINSI